MEDLITKAAGRRFHISAPYRSLTKAELLAKVPSDVDDAMSETVSCDTGFAARVRNHRPCGRCTSCLLRRQAIYGSRRDRLDNPDSYRYPAKGSEAMFAMLWQVMRLRNTLSAVHPWPAVVEEFPEIEYAQHYMTAEEILRMYRRYVEEWELLVKAVPVGDAWSFGKDGG